MDTLSYKTISANKSTVDKQWLLVDAEGQTLGRLASKVAKILRGKYKTNFTPMLIVETMSLSSMLKKSICQATSGMRKNI